MEPFIDYYDLLEVDLDASPGEIKAAFKKLALRYHPDVYKGDDAHKRMRLLLLAYQTLNDSEARRQYNARRSEHLLDRRGSRTSVAQKMPARSAVGRTPSDVSSRARRDRQRRYAFPDFRNGQPMHVDLGDIAYTLTANEARSLVGLGLLRGSKPDIKKNTYFCHRCHHSWYAELEKGRGAPWDIPRICPNCQAKDWFEYLLLRCVHCSAVFESEQIRYEIGHYTYGKSSDTEDLCPPYELFPLCPYCGTARWCPAEDLRVNALRHHAEQRASLLRLFWIGLALVMIIVVGAVAIMIH